MQIIDMGDTLDITLNDEDVENLKIGIDALETYLERESHFLSNYSKGWRLNVKETIRFLEWIVLETTGKVEDENNVG